MGRPINSLVGQRFGSLTVIERAENPNNRQTKWLCRCDCGETYVAYGPNLKSGRITSCGCKRTEIDREQERRASISLDRLRKDASDPYQNLANAIVAVAVDDYRDVLKDGNKKLLTSLEEFFYSSWYKTLTKVDPDALLSMLRREHCGNLKVAYI